MFTVQLEKGFSFTAYFVQQILAIFLTAVWALTTSSLPEKMNHFLPDSVANVFAVLWYICFVWSIGLPLGFAVQRLFPGAASTGRWVWILPCVVFAGFFLHDAVVLSFGTAVAEFFKPGPDGEAFWA